MGAFWARSARIYVTEDDPSLGARPEARGLPLPKLTRNTSGVRTADYHFDLPTELIAQTPTPTRGGSRLLVYNRPSGSLLHQEFANLRDHFRAGDVLVLNNSRVIPARLLGRKTDTGGEVEALLLEEVAPNDWWAMLRPGKRLRPGSSIAFSKSDSPLSPIQARVVEKNAEGHGRLQFDLPGNLLNVLNELGEIPLPPYIHRPEQHTTAEDRIRYQTVYARPPGSVAAPTAGLHFTPDLLASLSQLGVQVCFVTLHVGLSTFAPVKVENPDHHVMHEERFEIPTETALAINAARKEQRRVIAVGTTTLRALESAAQSPPHSICAGSGRTRIFIRPPFSFRAVDALITNFHLPESTLLMLVCAFAQPGQTSGREEMLRVYREAVAARYRFFSYGDAMLIL